MAVGPGSNAGGDSTVAVGDQATAAGSAAVAIGRNASADTTNADTAGVAIGSDAQSDGGTAVGFLSRASGTGSAFGAGSQATGLNSIALGTRGAFPALASGDGSFAVGNLSVANATSAMSIGRQSSASGAGAVALGQGANAAGTGSLALGGAGGFGAVGGAQATGGFATAIGFGSRAVGTNSVAIGAASVANSESSTVVGYNNQVTGERSGAFGTGNIVTGTGSYAVGDPNILNGNNTTVVGNNNTVNAGNNAGFGDNINVHGSDNSIAAGSSAAGSTIFGNGSTVNGINGIVIGNNTSMTGANGMAIGLGADTSAAGGMALGNGTVVRLADAVALGANTSVLSGTTSTAGNAAFGVRNNAGTQAVGTGRVASIGNPGAERQIQNLAAGAVTAGSTDAINGSQLFAVANNANAAGTGAALAIGGGATYDVATGVFTGPAYALNGSAANFTTVVGGLQALASGGVGPLQYGTPGTPSNVLNLVGSGAAVTLGNVATGALNAASTDAVNGSQLFATNQTVASNTTAIANINNGAGIRYFRATSAGADSVATGADSIAIGPNAVASFAQDIALGSGSVTAATVATTGTTIGGTAYTFAGAVPTSTVSVGAAGAERTVTNVAAGRLTSASTDAVNGSQLFATNQQVTSNTTQINNLANGIASGSVGLVQQTGGSSGGGPITIGATTGGTSINVAGTGGNRVLSGVAAGVADTDAVNVAQLAAAITSGAMNAVQYDGPGRTSVTFNAGGAPTALRNVAAGTVAAGSTDAINGGQLAATNQQIANIQNGQSGPFRSNNTSALAAPSATGNDAVAGGFGAVASGARSTAIGAGSSATGQNSVALGYASNDGGRGNVVSVGLAGRERQITNVAAGVQNTDAVNVGQFNNGLSSTLSAANTYTDNRINALNFDIAGLRRRADAGTASAMAMAGLPQANTPGKGMIAGGFGVYGEQAAFSLGLSKASDDGNTVVRGNATVATQRGTVGAAVGVGYQF